MLILDGRRRVHHRIEGYLPPREFMAGLSLGLGRYYLSRMLFAEAAERFAEVSLRHSGAAFGAEAEYWLGIARFKATANQNDLSSTWKQMARKYSGSEWAVRTQIPRSTNSFQERT